MIEIYDDIVPPNMLRMLEKALILEHPWYFSWDEKGLKSQDVLGAYPRLTLGTIRNIEEFNPGDNMLLKLLGNKFNTSNIKRVFCNCFRKGDDAEWHTDPAGTSYIFYLNTRWKRHWGAPTAFEGRKVYPKPGRLVRFSANIKHRGTAPSIFMPGYIPGRLSMVFQEGL